MFVTPSVGVNLTLFCRKNCNEISEVLTFAFALAGRQSEALMVLMQRASDRLGPERSFSDSVADLLDRIDYKLAHTAEEREKIFRLRYQAYLREDAILPNPSKSFADRYDDMDNVYLFGLYIEGELASSIRIQVDSKEHPYSPSLDAFRDVLQPKLDAGRVIIDATRFVADEGLSKRFRALPYVTVRLNWLAAAYFANGYSVVAVRPEHAPFYRRTFGLRLICEARPYPNLTKPLCLLASDYQSVADYVHQRYPFFRSTFFERRMLFERSSSQGPAKSQGQFDAFVKLEAPPLAG
jgi:hypothetical protein